MGFISRIRITITFPLLPDLAIAVFIQELHHALTELLLTIGTMKKAMQWCIAQKIPQQKV